MLNGTMCATDSTKCCIVQNYQTPEGVKALQVSQPFMGVITDIKRFFYAKKNERSREADKAKAKAAKGGNKKQKDAEEKKE